MRAQHRTKGGTAIRNTDLRVDLAALVRRDIQKTIALDGLLIEMRRAA